LTAAEAALKSAWISLPNMVIRSLVAMELISAMASWSAGVVGSFVHGADLTPVVDPSMHKEYWLEIRIVVVQSLLGIQFR
jgi:hypothetical protein